MKRFIACTCALLTLAGAVSCNGIRDAKAKAEEAEKAKRDGILELKEESYKLKNQADAEIKEKKKELNELSQRIDSREKSLDKRDELLTQREKNLEDKDKDLLAKQKEIDIMSV